MQIQNTTLQYRSARSLLAQQRTAQKCIQNKNRSRSQHTTQQNQQCTQPAAQQEYTNHSSTPNSVADTSMCEIWCCIAVICVSLSCCQMCALILLSAVSSCCDVYTSVLLCAVPSHLLLSSVSTVYCVRQPMCVLRMQSDCVCASTVVLFADTRCFISRCCTVVCAL